MSTLYEFFSKQKNFDLVFSVFWGLWVSKWGLDGVGGGSPSAHQPPDPILTPIRTPLPPENARKHDRLLAFLKVNTSMTTKIIVLAYIFPYLRSLTLIVDNFQFKFLTTCGLSQFMTYGFFSFSFDASG